MPEETNQAAPFRGVHEFAVNGSVIEQTHDFLDAHMKPDVIEIVAPDGTKALAIVGKNGVTVLDPASLDAYRDTPRYREGTATLLDLESFIDHAQRFLGTDSVVFADNNRAHPSLTSVIDYHTAGHDAAPRWGRHRGHFAFPLSDEWKAWNELNGKGMEMPVFARFLEDRITDVLPVSLLHLNDTQSQFVELLGGTGRIAQPAKLMEIATGLRVYEEVETVQAFRTQTGETRMNFESRQPGRESGEMAVPSLFAIGIPVFTNGEPYQILVQLRYRPSGNGKVVFFYELWREDRVFNHAFDEACTEVAERTGLPVLLGSPEGDH